jgi:N-acyl-D-amino-acid deacylase
VVAADLHQGITSHVVGQDGFGFAPADEPTLRFMESYLRPIYGPPAGFVPGTIAAFLRRFDGASTVNVATLVPNGCVRMMVMGNAARAATGPELLEMERLCRDGMHDGAVGLSSGLDYVPSGYAGTEELTRLARAVGELGGVYVSHVRYREGLRAALDEAIEIGAGSGAATHISHLMAEPFEGIFAADVLAIVEGARARGVDMSYDVYPYTFGCTTLLLLLPLWAVEGPVPAILGRLADPAARARIRQDLGADGVAAWGACEIAGTLAGGDATLVGSDVLAAATRAGQEPVDFVCDLLVRHELDVLLLGAEPADPIVGRELDPMLAHPVHVFGSDGIHAAGRAHPRTYGAAARMLGELVRERAVLTLEDAVRRMTSLPARRFGLAGRGIVRPGAFADLVLLDPDTIGARATRSAPLVATGVRDVYVNGVVALCEGRPTGATPGVGIRGPAARTCNLIHH